MVGARSEMAIVLFNIFKTDWSSQYQHEQYTYCKELLKVQKLMFSVPSLYALRGNIFDKSDGASIL